MAQHNVKEILAADGSPVYAEVANRDALGRKIDTTYATTDYVTTGYLPLSGGNLTSNLTVSGTVSSNEFIVKSGLAATTEYSADTITYNPDRASEGGDSPLILTFPSNSGTIATREWTQQQGYAVGNLANYLPLSGGTLTGNLNIQNGLTVRDSVTAYSYGFGENMPYIMNTSSDDRHLWIASKDFVYAMRNIDGEETRGVDFSDFPVWGNTAKVASEEWVGNVSTHAPELFNQDLNDLTSLAWTGFYYGQGSNTVKNKPEGVEEFGLIIMRSAGSSVTQILTSKGEIYVRVYSNNTWTEWSTVATEEFVNTYAISAKPRVDGTTGVSNDVDDLTKLPDTSNTIANIHGVTLSGLYGYGTMLDFECSGAINGSGRTQIYIPDMNNESITTNFIGIREQYQGFPTSAEMNNVAWKYIPTMSTTDAIATQNWVSGVLAGGFSINAQAQIRWPNCGIYQNVEGNLQLWSDNAGQYYLTTPSHQCTLDITKSNDARLYTPNEQNHTLATQEWVTSNALTQQNYNHLDTTTSYIAKFDNYWNNQVPDAYAWGTGIQFLGPSGDKDSNTPSIVRMYVPDNPKDNGGFYITQAWDSSSIASVAWSHIPDEKWTNDHYLPLSGGTMTGALTVNSDIITTGTGMVRAYAFCDSGQRDWVELRYGTNWSTSFGISGANGTIYNLSSLMNKSAGPSNALGNDLFFNYSDKQGSVGVSTVTGEAVIKSSNFRNLTFAEINNDPTWFTVAFPSTSFSQNSTNNVASENWVQQQGYATQSWVNSKFKVDPGTKTLILG